MLTTQELVGFGGGGSPLVSDCPCRFGDGAQTDTFINILTGLGLTANLNACFDAGDAGCYPQLMEVMKFQLTIRRRFDQLVDTDPSTLTDLERAARFLYLQRLTFGGKVEGRTFGVDPGRPARFDLNRLTPLLEALHERLAGVVIEGLDFEAFLGRYDRPETLFYLDPPYVGSEGYYGKELFAPADLDRLAAACRRLKGKFILSNVDCPQVREAFDGCRFIEAENTFTVKGRGQGKKVTEVIVVGGSV